MSKLLGSRLIAGQIDDDLIRRLIHGIEEMADGYAGEYGNNEGRGNVKWAMDGDAFLAYQHVRGLLAECYPETYSDVGGNAGNGGA